MAVALRNQVHFDLHHLAHADAWAGTGGLPHFPGSQGLKRHLNRITDTSRCGHACHHLTQHGHEFLARCDFRAVRQLQIQGPRLTHFYGQ